MQNDERTFDLLLSKYLTREISGEEQEMLFSLVMQSQSFREQYEKAAKLNAVLHVPVFESRKESDYLSLKIKNEPKKTAPFDRLGRLGRIAAAIALVLVSSTGAIYLHSRFKPAEEICWTEASTQFGGQTRLVLPDGTVAWVNAKSELKYSTLFGSSDREIHLKGEGYFEVARNEDLPFSVRAGDMTVTATGTQFNVRSYPDDNEWEVDLMEGGVDVDVIGKSFALTPDHKITYDRTAGTAVVEQFDTAMAAQWTKGKLAFYQASIPEIYKMLERHFNVRIAIDSEELKEEYFLGSISLNMSLSAILSYLDVDNKYKVEIKDDIIVVKNK